MEIIHYDTEHAAAIVDAIKQEPDWNIFTNGDAIDRYRKALAKSITYVCVDDDRFCGYVRALLDDGFAVYISELYVVPEYRNQHIGRSLLERIRTDYSGLTVYALSDEDAYYLKLGYKHIGSVFEL